MLTSSNYCCGALASPSWKFPCILDQDLELECNNNFLIGTSLYLLFYLSSIFRYHVNCKKHLVFQLIWFNSGTSKFWFAFICSISSQRQNLFTAIVISLTWRGCSHKSFSCQWLDIHPFPEVEFWNVHFL